jgi:hypothetical protein
LTKPIFPIIRTHFFHLSEKPIFSHLFWKDGKNGFSKRWERWVRKMGLKYVKDGFGQDNFFLESVFSPNCRKNICCYLFSLEVHGLKPSAGGFVPKTIFP